MPGMPSEGLDKAVAGYLIAPSSREALKMVREARTIFVTAEKDGEKEIFELAMGHHGDCLKLHSAILTLESDPEIVKRNIVARVISGVFPVLNTIEEYRSFEDKSLWDMVINSFGILSEIATATQYLEGTKLAANSHSERALVEVEERLVEMVRMSGGEILEDISSIEEFLDSVRSLQIATREKPFIPFILWSLISIISYKKLKDAM